jgi:hypothetical protein
MSKKLTQEEVLRRFHEERPKREGENINYSLFEYIKFNIKSKFICENTYEDGTIHGIFEQTPDNHLKGKGCKKCAIHQNIINQSLTQQEFEYKANMLHHFKYDYSKSIYINNHTNICIICPIHGEFWQLPATHLRGSNCPLCAYDFRSINQTSTKEQFIIKSIKEHGTKYDYSKVNYINSSTKVCIGCPQHGEFWQTPNSHLGGQGCPICNESVGERKIRLYLTFNSIPYEYQFSFKNCRGKKRPLVFDFYLKQYNLCIEFNGSQHYDKNSKYYSKDVIENDIKKVLFCKENNIKLIVIKFTRIKGINKILDELFKNIT